MHDIMMSVLGQWLSRFRADLNMVAMIGTSDRLCWLAESCAEVLGSWFFHGSSSTG